MSQGSRWVQVAEVGTMRALRFGGWFHRRFGRGPITVAMVLAAAYFAARNGEARRGSRRYLERITATPEGRRALGRGPRLVRILRHFFEFGMNLYDRLVVWGGALDTFELEHDGSGEIFALAESGRGVLLLGAHVGSLDMLGFIARRHDLVVNVVAYYENAERINAFFESQGPEQVRMIQLDPASIQAAFAIRACLARGEIVVILADRPPPEGVRGGRVRTSQVSFLGKPARFPMGPFLLAGVLECPVYLALCVSTGRARYTTLMRRVAPARRVPKGEREKHAQEILARYVNLLEQTCQRVPYQWFNFYDFWEEAAS
jgi:predicted LPLAT superfamily acyltransferase